MEASQNNIYDTDWYQTDWVWGPYSVHVATRKEWFTTFHDFKSKITVDGLNQFDVLGVGNVELELTNIDDGGQRCYRKIILKDVLHVRDLAANIFGGSQYHPAGVSYEVKYSEDDHLSKLPKIVECQAADEVGRLDNTARSYDQWCEKPLHIVPSRRQRDIVGTAAQWASGVGHGPLILVKNLGKLWLKGQQLGHTSMAGSEEWPTSYPTADWDSYEREIWQASAGFEYTDEGKTWLRHHHGNELKYLRRFGCSIYDVDHRAAGRHIVSKMLNYDGSRRAALAYLYYNARQSEGQTANDFYTYMQGLEACMKIASMSVMDHSRVEFYYSKLRLSNGWFDDAGQRLQYDGGAA